ncbi:DNA polymerase III subunit alpha [Pseudothermotoga sp.]|uniref:helix-hairpin-helix domain-containing protein n=1 Tax=Pseudothermotoga sp. TaxID=2033661 RepID=UPI0031FD033B
MKSLLLADTNFHAAVRFNELCQENNLIPVHSLRKGQKIFYARDREEFEELVRSYNENREPRLNSLDVKEVRLVYYLDRSLLEAHRFMARLVGSEPCEGCEASGRFLDPAEVLGVRRYDLKVSHKLLNPPEGWLDELFERLDLERKTRLLREVKVVRKLGFEPYFYTVKRVVDIARQNGILIGPGRGSAVGSLLAYLLGITSIDPIPHGLMFERFLHEERREPPDIDIDVADEQRDKLLGLLKDSFPYFAQISTFVTLTEKSLFNEARRLNLDVSSNVTKALAGLPLRRSIHAAGIVLAAEPLNLPLVPSSDQSVIEYDMDSLECIGVVKIDVLGLRTLTILNKIRKRVDMKTMPFNDGPTYELLGRGKTCGIFQLESATARNLCRLIRPSNLEELSILLALNRPGPLAANLEKTYARRKRGCQQTEENMFVETHGVIAYQEQVMRLAMEAAGFSAAEADLFRKAISEKNPEVLEPALQKFRNALHKKGYRPDFVEKLCDVLVKFAAYAFNKSHSVAYSHLSYELAYLKARWPKEFFDVYVREHSSEQFKVFLAVQELRSLGYKVLPPSISFGRPEDKAFHLPLETVDGVGESTARMIQELAPFSSLRDFAEKTGLPVSTIQRLVWTGAFDEMYGSRSAALEDFEAYQKGFDQELSLVTAKVFGKRAEVRQKPSYNEVDFAELEERAFGFALTPFAFENEKKFAPLAEVFASSRILPVAVKVSGNFASDGCTIVRLKDRLPDGYYALVIAPNGRIVQQKQLDEVQCVVYKLENCFDERDIERASELECVETVLCGKKVILSGFRPLVDWYRIELV